jgi:Holliday junction resolvase YEN1
MMVYQRPIANPALRNMFHRVIRLARAGVRALFVFDGPHRPTMKRGHPVWRGKHSIQTDFEGIVEAFGFEWRVVG